MRVLNIKDQFYDISEQVNSYITNKSYSNITSAALILLAIIVPFIVYRILSTFKKTRKSRFFYIHNQSAFKSFVSLFFRKVSRWWFLAISVFTSSYLFWHSPLDSLAKPLSLLGFLFAFVALYIQIFGMYQFKPNEQATKSKLKITLITLFIFTIGTYLFLVKILYAQYVLCLLVIFFSILWKKEIKEALINTALIGKYFEDIFQNKWHALLLPILLPIALLKHLFQKLSVLFLKQELYIKITNQIMKTKLSEANQKVTKHISKVPKTYQFLFNEQSLSEKRFHLPFPNDTLQNVEEQILQWRNSHISEQSLALIGKKGSGKTSFLRALYRSAHLKSCQKIYFSLNKKITNPKDVNNLISKLFSIEFSGGIEAIIELDKTLPHTVVVLDNLHSAFLSEEDGLEAMKYIIRLINAETKNIFWIASFDYYSWSFLSNIIGQKYFFRRQIQLPKWDISSIRKMIKIRHGISGYSLSFDLIKDVLNNNQEDKINSQEAEEKFFNLLAHQSECTPGLALAYWSNAVQVESYKKMRVFLPPEELISFEKNQLEDSSLFVYAAILRHVELNLKQAIAVTSLPKGVVANAFKLGIERSFLQRDVQGNYHAVALRQRDLITYLSKKNFIYE